MSVPPHAYLISNGCTKLFPKNKLTKFKNILPQQFNVEVDEKIKVSVEAIGFSALFGNILTPQKGLPSIIVIDDVTECSVANADGCNLIEKNTPVTIKQLASCYTAVKWYLDEYCDANMYFIKDQFYTEADIKNLCEKITNENKVLFTYINNVLSIKAKPEHDKEQVYIFLHPTFVQTFQIPNLTTLTEKGYELSKRGGDITLDAAFRKMAFNDPLIYKHQLYNGYRIVHELEMKPIVGKNCSNLKRKLPKIIRLQSSIIRSQVLNDTYSKDMVVFCTEFKDGDNYYFQEFVQPETLELLNTNLHQIDLSLRDEKGEKLQLITGVPTIVKLKFEKMNQNIKNFNIRLTSATNSFYPNNVKSNFRVKLPKTFNLGNQWKVALTSITHPNSYKMFIGMENDLKKSFFFIKENSDEPVNLVTFQNKNYSIHQIIEVLNSKQPMGGEAFILAVSYLLNKKIKIYPEKNCQMAIGNNLLDILGFDGIKNTDKDYTMISLTGGVPYVFGREVNLNALKPHLMIVYCSIVKPIIFGDDYLNVLRVLTVPENEEKTGAILQEFQNKHFLELSNTELTEIEINFRTQDGELIEFHGDSDVILNLEFSNVE